MGKTPPIRKRKSITLETKLNILAAIASGREPKSICSQFELSESTVRTIRDQADSIRRSVTCVSNLSKKRLGYHRDNVLEVMEERLIDWLRELKEKNLYVSKDAIKENAIRIYKEQLEIMSSTSNVYKEKKFCASKGWLSRFMKRNATIIESKPSSETEISEENSQLTQYSSNEMPFEVTDFLETEKNEIDTKSWDSDKMDESSGCQLTASSINEGLVLGKFMVNHFLNIDPNKERALKFERTIYDCLAQYEKLFVELKHTESITPNF